MRPMRESPTEEAQLRTLQCQSLCHLSGSGSLRRSMERHQASNCLSAFLTQSMVTRFGTSSLLSVSFPKHPALEES